MNLIMNTILFQPNIKQFLSHNGGKYIEFYSHIQSRGISHITSPPHTTEHNGHAVHIGILLKPVYPYSHVQKCPLLYIGLLPWLRSLISFIGYLQPISKTPHQITLFNKQPNYDKLRVLVAFCFPWLRPYSSQLHPKSKPWIFVGYSPSQCA